VLESRAVKRFKAFDPPEYVDWKLHPAALRAFRARLAPRAVAREVAALPPPLLLRFYDGLVRTRLYDITLKRWVKQGVISKAWLGTGEEAVTVGNCAPLEPGDAVGPMIRNAGSAFLRGMPLEECFRIYLGSPDSVARGHDLHLGDFERRVFPPISMVGAFVPVLAGVALAMKRSGERRVAMTWVGDGSTRTGEFHEGMSLAATLGVPLVVVLQDNGVALGTPTEVHLKAPLDTMAAAYGVLGYACDGNNVIDTYLVTRRAVRECRAGKGPAIIVAKTFRMGGHATHDEAEARHLFPKAVFEAWGRRDPIGVYEEWLVAGDRDLDAWVAEDGAIREAAGRDGVGTARASHATRKVGGRTARRTGSAAPAKSASARARADRNRAALARVEARAAADTEAAAALAQQSKQKPFADADAVEGVYEIPESL
jgi:TPP-dependent pyruvate/acetoin dehydrogenase alpha subunit